MRASHRMLVAALAACWVGLWQPGHVEALTRTLHTAEAAAAANGVEVTLQGASVAMIQNSADGSWDGTLTYEVSVTGTSWVAVRCVVLSTGEIRSQTVGEAALVQCPTAGAVKFRARISDRAAGSTTVVASFDQGSVSAAGTHQLGSVDVRRAPAPATVDTEQVGLTADATLEPATANLRLMGWTIRESATVAGVATAILRHGVVSGGNCSGNAIAYIELAANQSVTMSYELRGVATPSGVCVDVLAGTIDLNVLVNVEPTP